jgi:hypothetical protein
VRGGRTGMVEVVGNAGRERGARAYVARWRGRRARWPVVARARGRRDLLVDVRVRPGSSRALIA